MDEKISVKIRRTSGTDNGPVRFDSYVVTREDRMNVLDVVNKIQSTQDGSLAFRYSCRVGMCGTCSMRVNGRNRWTCRTAVDDLGSDLVIEPLPNYPVVRDLVVDMKPFLDSQRRIKPHFVPGDPKARGFAQIKDDSVERKEINRHVECITCGNCYGACSLVTTNKKYVGPAAINRAYTLITDSRDGAGDDRLALLNSHSGVWGCHTQFNCTEVCPMGISPTRAIQKLKRKEIARGITEFFGRSTDR